MRRILALLLLLGVWYKPLFCETKVYFSPDGGIQKEIINCINESKKTVEVMIYSFTARKIALSLIDANKRGVKVRIITDDSQSNNIYSVIPYLISEGIEIKKMTGQERGLMHHKAAIFDSKKIITGSYCWTTSAEYYNYENVIISDEKDLVKEYVEEFENIWNVVVSSQ